MARAGGTRPLVDDAHWNHLKSFLPTGVAPSNKTTLPLLVREAGKVAEEIVSGLIAASTEGRAMDISQLPQVVNAAATFNVLSFRRIPMSRTLPPGDESSSC